MPELKGIDNVMFAVADLDAAVRFYGRRLPTAKSRPD